MAQTPDDAAEPGEPEETVIIDRDADAHTEIVEREVDHTEVIDREVDHTEVIDREVDHTEVIDRSAPAAAADPEADPVADAGADAESTFATLAVVRETAAKSLRAPARRRRGITLPPVEPGFGREAVAAVGPGAVSTYEPRAIPEPPALPAVVESGPEATRLPAPAMPSVVRSSRRAGLITLAVFVASIAVSVAGLILIGSVVFR